MDINTFSLEWADVLIVYVAGCTLGAGKTRENFYSFLNKYLQWDRLKKRRYVASKLTEKVLVTAGNS